MYLARLKKDCATFSLSAKKRQDLKVHLTGSPDESSIEDYSRFMKKKGVTDVFCFCSLSYNPAVLENRGINFHHLQFEDGSRPPDETLAEFDTIIDSVILTDPNPCIAIHCHAGMGRAPTVLAYLMISRYRWDSADSVQHIRRKRKAAINTKQLDWILYAKIRKIGKREGCVIL